MASKDRDVGSASIGGAETGSPIRQALTDQNRHLPALPLDFGFRYRGARFTAHVRGARNGAVLTLGVTVGWLPYTGDSAAARRILSDILTIAAALPHFRPQLSKANELRIVGELAIEGEATPERIAATVIAGVVSIKPLIDLVQMLLPPRADQLTGGTTKT